MTRCRIGGLATLLVAAIAAAGCGDAAENGADTDADAAAAAADTAAEPDTSADPRGSVSRTGDIRIPEQTVGVQVTLTEWGVTVADSVISSGPVTVVIQNRGDLPHIVEMTGEYAGRWRTAPVQPGASALMSMNLSPGTYTIFCPEEPEGQDAHRARGMEGRLVVR